MAPIDPPVDPAPDARPAGKEIDENTRQRLFEVLHRELAASSQDALTRGVPPERLAALLDERAALLRAQIWQLTAAEDVTDDADDTA
jgi:hypothetical protein